MSYKNSFISILENIALLNKNNVEILTKINDIVASNTDVVTITLENNDGSFTRFELPTVGWLKKEIDIINYNIKKILSLDNNSTFIFDPDTKMSKKIKIIDLNSEPNKISNLNIPNTFSKKYNWFFENLMNPILNVEIDLTNKIDEGVNKVLVRKYILSFERDENGFYTVDGNKSLSEFEDKFLNKNDIIFQDFIDWLNNPLNLGVLDKNDENNIIDEEIYDINYKSILYSGNYSVLKIEKDSINEKIYYHINTLDYYDKNGNIYKLNIGDVLVLNTNNSSSKYRIKEIDISSSLYKVSLERIEGLDPIPIGNNILKYYSNTTNEKKINVSIGFDQYIVLFLKLINTDNNVISHNWSNGIAFYTNNLVLDLNNNIDMVNYYINNVYNYGEVLKDMVAKKIPNKFGEKPNKPILIKENFKVVQINKHLTDNKDLENIQNIYSQKVKLKSDIDQLNKAIIQKNVELNTKNYKSLSEKSKVQNELNSLLQKKQHNIQLYSSLISELTSININNKVEPKYRIRGFWDIPQPIIKKGYRPQEVIGFEIQYRYLSKNNVSSNIEEFNIKNKEDGKTKKAYYSQWNSIKTDIRKRDYDPKTNTFIWKIEDVSDPDLPNINQLDIPIQPNERVEIKVRSISEVGYPESPLYSDWSDSIIIDFPDELNNVLSDTDFILEEASKEDILISFENELHSKGVLKHIDDSLYINEKYYPHGDKSILTSFKDNFGNLMSLYDYLKQLSDKIITLEEIIKRSKGEIKITIFNGKEEEEIYNGAIINIPINCEDYMTFIQSGSTTTNKRFANMVYLIQDYYIKIENISNNSDLSLLTKYDDIHNITSLFTNVGYNAPSFVSSDSKLKKQLANQYLYLCNKANINGEVLLYGGDMTNEAITTALCTDYLNLSANILNNTVVDNIYWYNSSLTNLEFGATIHPYIEYSNNDTSNILVDKNNNNIHLIPPKSSIKIPLYIYFKPNISSSDTIISININDEQKILKKALRFYLEEESKIRPFEFTIVFKLIRNRKIYISSNNKLPIDVSNVNIS